MQTAALSDVGVVLSTYVPVEVAERIRARARAADRSVAAEIRRAIHLYNDETLAANEGLVKSAVQATGDDEH